MQNLEHEELLLKITENESKVTINWLGKSRLPDPSEVLDPYLQGLAEELRGKEVVCDFTTLEFMNSSTVPSILDFTELLDENGIKTTIYFDSSLEWQNASFGALNVLIMDMENVDIISK